MVIGVLMVFGTIAITSFLAVHDHNKRKAVLGTAGLVATAILYASPLSVIVSFTLQWLFIMAHPSFRFSYCYVYNMAFIVNISCRVF